MEPVNEFRNYKLRTTCLKNGGFRQYVKLPSQHVFQHVYWVLGDELEVQIKRKQTFFNRETSWMRLPTYLIINKGIIIIYVTADQGYILRVASALKINFVADKKPIKKKLVGGAGPNFTYSAHLSLSFPFGEANFRFVNESDDKLRSWRTLILASHQSQKGLARVGRAVAQELFRSNSLESVISAKSVVPVKESKKQPEEVEIQRRRRDGTEDSQQLSSVIEGAVFALKKSNSEVSTAAIPSTRRSAMKASVVSVPSTTSIPPIQSYYETVEGGDETYLDESTQDNRQLGFSNTTTTVWKPFDSFAQTPSGTNITTSEVDVSFKDLHPVEGSVTSVQTAILGYNDGKPVEGSNTSVQTAILGYSDAFTKGNEDSDDDVTEHPVHKPLGVANFLKRHPSSPIARQTMLADILRQGLAKKPLIDIGESPRSKAMEYWKKKETEVGFKKPSFSPVSVRLDKDVKKPAFPVTAPRRVRFRNAEGHDRGQVFNSPTKYYYSVEDAANKNDKFGLENESYI